jgi:hypothetical protein
MAPEDQIRACRDRYSSRHGERPGVTVGTAARHDGLACTSNTRVPTDQKKLLRVRSGEAMYVRAGVLLCLAGVPVTHVTTLVVNARLPHDARASLGVTRTGSLMPAPGSTPLGRAARTRSPPRATGNSDHVRLHRYLRRLAGRTLHRPTPNLGRHPMAWVIERIYAGFLEAFPPSLAKPVANQNTAVGAKVGGVTTVARLFWTGGRCYTRNSPVDAMGRRFPVAKAASMQS